MLEVFLLIAGFIFLIQGANLLVNNSVRLAKRFQVPPVLIGLTIVAIGTGLPEVVVSSAASLQGNGSLAVSNVIGSNLVNLVLILGLCALLRPLEVNFKEVSRDFWFFIGITGLFLAVVLSSGLYLNRLFSLILLLLFFLYLGVIIRKTLRHQKDPEGEVEIQVLEPKKPLLGIFLLMGIGGTMVIGGGQLVVEQAVGLAQAMGISQRVIGLTLVAGGTSLPELATCLVACKKGENEFALGNVLGSCTFNILFILGLTGTLSPLLMEQALILDLVFLIAASLIVFFFVRTDKKLSRWEGAGMLLMYASYLLFIIN